MLVCHDLKCRACGHILDNHRHKRGELPPCPECEGELFIFWGLTQQLRTTAAAVHTWEPMVYEGEAYETPQQWNAHLKAIEANTGKTVHLVPNTKADRQVRHDEAKHRAWETRKAAGIDDQQVADRRRELKRRRELGG